MKKNLLLLSFLIVFFNLSFGQTPTTYHSTVGGGNNVFPFQTNTGNRVQWLYIASDFTGGSPLSPGLITDIYMRPSSSNSPNTYTNFTVKLGMTTMTATTATWITTGMTTVLTSGTYSIPNATSGTWFKITLTTPFYYDGTSNIVLDISQTAYSGGFYINQVAAGTNRRIYGSSSGASPNGSDSQLPSFGFDLAPAVCTGIPSGGTAQAASVLIDCNTTTDLSLIGNTLGDSLSFQWQYNSGIGWTDFGLDTSAVTSTPVVISTQFRCIITCLNTGGGSDTSVPVTVDVLPLVVNLGNDTTLCLGTSMQIDAGFPGSFYLWNTNDTTQTITVNTSGSYNVEVTDTAGCIGHDTIAITQGIQPIGILPGNIDLCDMDTLILNAGNIGSSFIWNTSATTQSISVSSGGNYSVEITSVDGCFIRDSATIHMRPLPVVDLGVDTGICPNAFIILDAGNPGDHYLWNTNDTTQTIPTTDSGNYSVIVTTDYNCSDTDVKHIAFLSLAKTDGFNFIPLFYEDLGKVMFSAINPLDVFSYKWDFGDGTAVSTADSPTHTYAESGVYVVSLEVFNGCGSTITSLPIHVNLTTGIVSIAKEGAEIKLYPNPAKDLIIIENKSQFKMQQISIFNSLGRMVIQKSLNASGKQQLNVSALANGLYSARILTDKGWLVQRFEIVK